jgi:adenylate kinase family enzyme
LRQRFEVYQRSTAPVLNYYPADRIAPIDALRSPAEDFDQILHLVIPILNRPQAVPADDR